MKTTNDLITRTDCPNPLERDALNSRSDPVTKEMTDIPRYTTIIDQLNPGVRWSRQPRDLPAASTVKTRPCRFLLSGDQWEVLAKPAKHSKVGARSVLVTSHRWLRHYHRGTWVTVVRHHVGDCYDSVSLEVTGKFGRMPLHLISMKNWKTVAERCMPRKWLCRCTSSWFHTWITFRFEAKACSRSTLTPSTLDWERFDLFLLKIDEEHEMHSEFTPLSQDAADTAPIASKPLEAHHCSRNTSIRTPRGTIIVNVGQLRPTRRLDQYLYRNQAAPIYGRTNAFST